MWGAWGGAHGCLGGGGGYLVCMGWFEWNQDGCRDDLVRPGISLPLSRDFRGKGQQNTLPFTQNAVPDTTVPTQTAPRSVRNICTLGASCFGVH